VRRKSAYPAIAAAVCVAFLAVFVLPGAALASGAAPVMTPSDYPQAMGLNPRVSVWMAAQMHVWFAAFVLAVPLFVVMLEAAGIYTKDDRYDRVAHEFLGVSHTAYTLTALTGLLLLACLMVFYPKVLGYMTSIFKPTYYLYILFIVAENAAFILYYRLWKRLGSGRAKLVHLGIGILLNLAGVAIMFTANAWVTFMMSPAGVDIRGALKDGGLWAAVNNHLWSPMNLHRFVANIAYGGSIVAAYAAYRFLSAEDGSARAHYDWMGYTASLIAIAALLPLPFAGYWLTAEIYAYSQQMGITLMGGVFGWLFIIQAVLIGALFLAANYYLWCGFGRTEHGARYTGYIKYIAFVITLCFLVWFTPHNPTLTTAEAAALGGRFHPYLAPLGLMPAKNTAVNVMIIFTFLSFLLYRRSGRGPAPAQWAQTGRAVQAAAFTAAVANIVWLGAWYGYHTNTVYKVASSVPQVMTTLVLIIFVSLMEFFMYRKTRWERAAEPGRGDAGRWGRMPARSQYALILIAVSFTWLMGLMGYVRAAIRRHWHVFGIMRDASPDAFTPSISYAARVVSAGTIVFMGLVIIIFWMSGRRTPKLRGEADRR